MRRRVAMRAPLLATLVALLAVTTTAPIAQAADTLQDRATTSYELDAVHHLVHVTQVYTLANRKASTTTSKTCSAIFFDGYGGTYTYYYECGYRTSYYYNSWKEYFPNDARNFKVKASSGSAKIAKIGKKGSDGWKSVKFTYSPLNYGQQRTFKLQYDLPAGGPRSSAKRIATAAYASFCVFGPGTDKGRVRIVMPDGFELLGTSGMTQSSKGGKAVWETNEMKKPYRFSRCITGTNPKGVVSKTVGDSTIIATRDDAAWTKAVTAVVTDDLPKVAAFLGDRPAGTTLKITETRTKGQPFDPKTGEIALSEFATSQPVVLDALVGTWFDRDHFLTDWPKMGYVRWAEAGAGVTDLPCTDPGATPAGSLGLNSWAISDPVSGVGNDGTDLGAWKMQASCYVIKTVNDAIGPEKTAAVLEALRSGADPYVAGEQRKSSIVGWRDWLDTVTEVGLLPAGVDPAVATDLVKRFGITVDTDKVDAHAAAVTAYHALADRLPGDVPATITDAIRTWKNDEATSMIATATRALDTAATVPSIVSGVDVAGGPVEAAVLAATSQEDLDAAVALADKQVAAAKIAAAVVTTEAQPLDTMQQIGLMGSSLPGADAAVAAVAAADPAAAQAASDALDAALASASSNGTQRLGIGIGSIVVVLALVAGLVVFRGRRKSAAASASVSASLASSAAAVAEAPASAASASGPAVVDAAPPSDVMATLADASESFAATHDDATQTDAPPAAPPPPPA